MPDESDFVNTTAGHDLGYLTVPVAEIRVKTG